MTALGIVLPEQLVSACRYCGAEIISIRLRYYVRERNGLQSGEASREMHECPKLRTVLSELVDAADLP